MPTIKRCFPRTLFRPKTNRSVRVCSTWLRLMICCFRSTFMAYSFPSNLLLTCMTLPKLPFPTTFKRMKSDSFTLRLELAPSAAPAAPEPVPATATEVGVPDVDADAPIGEDAAEYDPSDSTSSGNKPSCDPSVVFVWLSSSLLPAPPSSSSSPSS